MKKIIVVIPVYNIEKYLEELRFSLENQSEKDFTVILVNDGSTDNSASFLKSWAKQDKRLVFIEKENGGLGSARNAALDWIKTNYQSDAYILFLDSDDLFETTMVEHVMKQANKLNVDILEFEGYPIFETPKLEAEHPTLAGWMSMNGDYSKPLPGPEYMVRSGVADTKSCTWLRAYRKDYLLEQNLRFPEGILHEDVFFAFASVFRAKQVACLHEKLYIYRIRPASITTRERGWENIKGRYYAILEGIKELNEHPELNEEQRTALTSVIEDWTISNYEDYKSIDKKTIHDKLNKDFAPGDAWLFYKLLVPEREKAKILEDEKAQIYASNTWKVGNTILAIPKRIKRILKRHSIKSSC